MEWVTFTHRIMGRVQAAKERTSQPSILRPQSSQRVEDAHGTGGPKKPRLESGELLPCSHGGTQAEGGTLCGRPSLSSSSRTSETARNALKSRSQTYFSLHFHASQWQFYSRNCSILWNIHAIGALGGSEMIVVRVPSSFHPCISPEMPRDICFVAGMSEGTEDRGTGRVDETCCSDSPLDWTGATVVGGMRIG